MHHLVVLQFSLSGDCDLWMFFWATSIHHLLEATVDASPGGFELVLFCWFCI
jgi:hypothetical protein